jgi:hypothetical protein
VLLKLIWAFLELKWQKAWVNELPHIGDPCNKETIFMNGLAGY